MKRTLLLTMIMLVLTASVSAQEIGLKTTMISGWKYTTDGFSYRPVGGSAKDLMFLMEGNDEAIEHIKAYKRNNSGYLILGGLSIAGTVLACALLSSDEEKKQEQGVMVFLVSLPLSIGSAAAGVSANNHLLEAVRIHNGSIRCHETNTAGGREPSGKPGFGVSFSLSF